MQITKKNVDGVQQTATNQSIKSATQYSKLINSDSRVSIKDMMTGDGAAKSQTLANNNYQVIDLPSRGWGYPADSYLSSGRIRLKLPTGRDQAILSSQNLIRKGIMIDEFLRALIIDNVKLQDLLTGDKDYLSFISRRLTYGNDYTAMVQCPKCAHQNKIEFDLANIPLKQTPDLFDAPHGTTECEFILPKTRKLVRYTLINGHIDNIIEKRIVSSKIPNIEILIKIACQIVQLDGKSEFNDILNELKDIPAMDTLALRLEIKKMTPEIIIKQVVQCKNPACGRQQEVHVPINVDFFWPGYGN